MVNQAGSWLWVACALISARIGSPSRSASERRVRTSAAAPSALAEELAAVIVPSGRKAGPQARDLLGRDLERVLVLGHHPVAALARYRHRRDLGGEGAALDRRPGPGQRLLGVGVLIGAAELIGLRRGLAEIAHGAATLIGVLEPVEQHVVEDAIVADAVAGTRLGQQVGRVGHRLHAAGQDDVGRAGQDQVVGQHGGLHARAAHLVDGGGAGGVGQAGAARGLAGGGLALAGGQDAAHQHLVDALRRQGGAIECGADRVRAQSGGGKAGQLPLKAAEGRSRGGDDDDGIEVGHEGHSAGLRRAPIGRRSLDDEHHD